MTQMEEIEKAIGEPYDDAGCDVKATRAGVIAAIRPIVETHDRRVGELVRALNDLVTCIETDGLIPESVSYMKQARVALAKSGKQ